MGAWIETFGKLTDTELIESHPSWVRGLKQCLWRYFEQTVKSHPSWVRGLKHGMRRQSRTGRNVAPLVGAWIETQDIRNEYDRYSVAPLVGAWIETQLDI